MSEPSQELPPRRVSTDTVIESRWAEADGFPLPLAGLIDMTEISQQERRCTLGVNPQSGNQQT